MKLVTFQAPTGAGRAGIAAGGQVFDLSAGAAALGAALPPDIVSNLELGEAGLAVARQVAAEGEMGRLPGWPEDRVRLLAAVPKPPKVLLLAGNYQSHITEGGAAPVEKAKITPRPFIKPGTAIIGTGDPIRLRRIRTPSTTSWRSRR